MTTPLPSNEPVWTFRGYQLKASEFTTAMVHFFRAEVQRANVWRQRLDTTTNWAVVTTGAAISFAFTQSGGHPVILLNLLLVTIFLIMETRRYRYYELWASRIRLMETDFFAAMLVPPFHPAADWAESLAENLLTPHFPISQWEAFGRRLRRNYLWIYAIVGLAWLGNLWFLPTPVEDYHEALARAALGHIPGEWTTALVAAFFLTMGLIAVVTAPLQQAPGEVLPRYGAEKVSESTTRPRSGPAWFRPSARREQNLAFIITEQAENICQRILSDMRRGVTTLPGKGAYTGQERAVLMVALTITEFAQLKAIVAELDPNAFVIIAPVKSIFGRGFSPLRAE
ncbi:MAG: DUF2270 domain-containing protein [Anaerolineales bacterium]|nr:DUF2270 domain-containing protein [Anaerolineales bacterium]MCX7756496.1 DUF2270 domain-containing protein [Anaerolineales bacterium]MDW8278637.1 DUF2270 domain-containing protein [Anaerolineales bacterium]